MQAAGVVKLADTPDLGSGAVRCAGSSPVTRILKNRRCVNISHLRFFVLINYSLTGAFGTAYIMLAVSMINPFAFLAASLIASKPRNAAFHSSFE